MAINTGRMQRRQRPRRVGARPAIIAALRDSDTRLKFAEKFGADMAEWRRAQPLGSLEDRGAAIRSAMGEVALDVCGPRLRTVEGWFAARADELRKAQLKRNLSTAAWAKSPNDASLRSVMKTDAKALKRDLRAAKIDHTIAQANACVGGGQAAFWAAVKELTRPEPRARPVPSLNFRDENGDLSTTPAEAAASATVHFTKV